MDRHPYLDFFDNAVYVSQCFHSCKERCMQTCRQHIVEALTRKHLFVGLSDTVGTTTCPHQKLSDDIRKIQTPLKLLDNIVSSIQTQSVRHTDIPNVRNRGVPKDPTLTLVLVWGLNCADILSEEAVEAQKS